MAALTPIKQRFWDNDGTLLAGGKVYVYLAGGTTPTNSYTDTTESTPNSWPVILDSKGEASIWTQGTVKINVLNASNVQITGYPVDNVGGTGPFALLVGNTSQAFSASYFSAGTLSPSATSTFYAGEAITAHAHYGHLDKSTINYSGVATQGHSSFAAVTTQSGVQNSDHSHPFQDTSVYTGSGILSYHASFYSNPDHSGTGVISTMYGYTITNPIGTGPITNLFGVYIDSLTRGTNNYAIYTAGATKSYFGGVVQFATTISVNGVTPSASGAGITLSATQNPSTDVNTLDDYREASFTGTLTGCTTSPTTPVDYVKVGNLVTMSISVANTITATSNATTMTITGGPAIIRPASAKIALCIIYDNGVTLLGKVQIGSDGVLTFYKDVAGAAFTNSGTKGVIACSWSYTL